MKHFILSVILVFTFVGHAQAATHCTGKVNGSYTDRYGNFYINASYRGTWTKICNVQVMWHSTLSEVCKDYIDSVRKAQITGLRIRTSYPDGYVCATLPTYGNTPESQYILLQR